MSANDWTFTLGSRSGSYFALALFSTMFAALGLVVAVETARRVASRAWPAVFGLAVFILPIVLIYASSLGGFYEGAVRRDRLALSYLLPFPETDILFSDVASIEARPSIRGRWRLHVMTADGRDYESATWFRRDIDPIAVRLRRRIRE